MKLKDNYPEENELTGKNPESAKINRRNLFTLTVIIVGLFPIVFISEDNILKIFLYGYIAYFIKTRTKDHGKKCGRMAMRFGKGKFINLKHIYLLFALSYGTVFIEDFGSEVLIYKSRHSYNPENKNFLLGATSFYKGAAILPDLINSVIAMPLDLVETKEGGFLDLTKKKYRDHIYYEAGKREVAFKIVDLRDRGMFIEKEERGVFSYFIKGTVVRIWDSIISALMFMIKNFIWALVYYLGAFKIAKMHINRNLRDYSKQDE